MKPVWQAAGWVAGGLLGTAAAAAAVLTATNHGRVSRQRKLAEELRGERVPRAADREFTVTADDGVPLSVEELDPDDGGRPDLTVVLAHGYTLDRRCWLFQRRDLAASTRPRIRQVLYDHRSHGRSGRSARQACTIEQLARDLDAVIRATAPHGPVVLIGHSMGGMTIMALAEQRPELFAERVCGVAFLNTSAGDVGRSGLPRPFLSRRNPLMIATARVARWQPGVVQRGRELGGDLIWSLIRRLAFADRAVDPGVVELMDTMMASTPLEVMTDFLPTLGAHDRYAALAGLRYVRALVIGAEADLLVPWQHSEAIAALLPDAGLVRIEGAGHMTMLEQPEQVSRHVLALLADCADSGRRGWQPA